MARFAFVGPSYRSQSVLADCQTCMNWYIESVESQLGRSGLVLYPTPGLNLLYNLGGAGVRGLITAQGRTFAVAGTTLWELLAPTANPNCVNRGNVVSDGKPVSMAGGGYQLLIASAGVSYVLNLSTNFLSTVDPSGGGNVPVGEVGYADGFFFALVMNPTTPWQINSSNLNDATTWQAVDFTIVSVFADNPNAIFFAARLMWVFGPKAIQPYANTGDFPFPFDVISGTYIENGLAAQNSVAKLDNSIFWLGSDERGNGVVWRANGFTPLRVSNHAIEYALQSYSTIADAVAYAYQDQGHSFYVLGFPTADKTWVYDAATQQWHERGYWNQQAGKFNRHRAAFHTFNFGMHLAGDYATGAVYQMAINIFSDFGTAIRRVRRAPHISKELDYTFHQRLQLDVEVGLGTFQGGAPTTYFWLTDSSGVNWALAVNDVGAFKVTPSNMGTPAALYLNDPVSNTSWQITVSTLGVLIPVSVAYNASYPAALPMVSLSGSTNFVAGVKQVATGIAQLTSMTTGIVGRGPQVTLRWSNDGGQTWSNGQIRDCGQTGNYRQRVLWNRLGRARDRVYEISVSDPVAWRIIDAYLEADGYQPSERLSKQIAKQA